MKKILSIAVVLLIALSFTGCFSGGGAGGGNGELMGVQKRQRFKETQPYGMVYVRRGSFNIGPSDQDASSAGVPTKTVSQEPFWMDDTEITNNEYRQFVEWVKEKKAREMLGEQYPEFLITEDREGNPIDPPKINWDEKIDWDDPDFQMAMEDLYYPENERFFGKREVDTRKLIYEYWWVDLNQAARRSNSYNFETQRYEGNVYNIEGELVPIENRSSFMMHDQVHVYPDTLCWIRDFTYSYNEPLATRYFWHPGFDEYPAVGITWKQANAFCNWRTKIQTDYLTERGEATLMTYRLPTEVEWEYAARGGKEFSMYPWGGYYPRDDKGVFLANFKPLRGNYVEDGAIATLKVGSYDPNEYGLYDMSGNVAEWTSTAYDEAGYNYFSDLNPTFTYNARKDEPAVMKRKVIRGGSWKDISQFVQVSTRNYEYQDTTKSYVGFRCVRSTFGEDFLVPLFNLIPIVMNLGELFKTKRWKAFMGYVYGWGAAVVLIGALFKLEHLQYSGLLLTIGLSTEALIFFLSAFEPPMDFPEWGKVYPELREDYELADIEELKPKRSQGLEQLLGSSELTPDLIDKVGQGLTELTNTAKGISDISSATLATDMYVKNLGSASESMNSFADINNKANENISNSVGTLVDSYSTAADQLSETGKRLSDSYNKSSEIIEGGLESIGSSSKEYAGNLERLNNNLNSLNSNFEGQLKDTQDQFKATQKFNQDLSEMNTILTSSVDELKKYKENAEQLNKNLEALNTIYGNMLGAMSYNK